MFFTTEKFDPNRILDELTNVFKNRLKVEDVYETKPTLTVLIDEVQVSFFEYKHKNIFETQKLDASSNITLLSIRDIIAMKVIAINQRGTKKDFFDFVNTVTKLNISPKELIQIVIEKFNNKDILATFIFSLVYFDDAENDELPETFVEFDWLEAKKYCLNYSKKLSKQIF